MNLKKLISALSVFIFLFAAPATVWAATLSLSPSTGTFNRGCSFSLDITLDTAQAPTDGTDVYLLYDNSRFTATSVTNGTIFPDYPLSNFDNSTGKISVSGIVTGSSYTGQGKFATVNFTANANAPAGISQINFDFDPNNQQKTTGTVVAGEVGGNVENILSAVTNGSYTIGTGTCNNPGAGTGTSGISNTSGASASGSGTLRGGVGGPISTGSASLGGKGGVLPAAGGEKFTFTLAIVGGALTTLGILGLALF